MNRETTEFAEHRFSQRTARSYAAFYAGTICKHDHERPVWRAARALPPEERAPVIHTGEATESDFGDLDEPLRRQFEGSKP